MAESRPIHVSVIEGEFASLKALGIPIPVCMHVQHGGFTFRKAMWTAKQSASEFSISFFWPEPHQGEKSNSSRSKCKTKKRKNNKKRELLNCKVSSGWGSLSTWVCTVYLNVCSCLVRFLLLSQILFYLNLSWMFLLRFRVYISNCILVVFFNHVSVSFSSVGACVKICNVILLLS